MVYNLDRGDQKDLPYLAYYLISLFKENLRKGLLLFSKYTGHKGGSEKHPQGRYLK